MATLSNRIKSLRLEHGLTQAEFGKMFGIVKSTVSLYENGRSVPNDQIKTEICRCFGVSMDYLLGLTDEHAASTESRSAVAPPPDPVYQEALTCLDGLSADGLAYALRCLKAIKNLEDVKNDSGAAIPFEKDA